MSGGAGDDKFWLGFGDRALGGDGNDQFFVGTGGNNLLSGGAGSDIFNIITAGTIPTSANTIIDFQLGTDKIGISGINASALSISQVGANAVISTLVGGQAIATLNGIQASSLSFANTTQFTFA
jgi:Ca2+-binding RTX toxin-like protein